MVPGGDAHTRPLEEEFCAYTPGAWVILGQYLRYFYGRAGGPDNLDFFVWLSGENPSAPPRP